MSRIPDDTNISKISIPGTHNSGAFFKLSAPSVRCQSESVDIQLNHGIRFLDIRLSKDFMSRGEKVNDLMVVHGKFPVRLSSSYKFKKILNEIYSFIDKNPTETILLSIKFENTMLNWNPDNDEFAKVLFQKYICHNRTRWYLSDKIPTLKYCRGKIILLRRFPVIEDGTYKKFGIPCNWNFSNLIFENNLICVQDYFDIKGKIDINKKAKLIKDMLMKSNSYHNNTNSDFSRNSDSSMQSTLSSSNGSSLSSSPNTTYSTSSMHQDFSKLPPSLSNNLQPKLFINFCSGSCVFQKQYWPSKVDKAIRKFNIDDYYTKNCGIVVFDFVERDDWKLIKKLIGVNFS